ncbi:MAG: GNAT family N-acetyltransferase [Oscillospiraceae bacterium]|nr:GNAT family N-acetyltransferase [Oscillospiraceae bacterium]
MIYKATESDIPKIADMAALLWEGHDTEELAAGFAEIIHSDECEVFLSMKENTSVGFAQVQLRHDYVEGTSSSPVGYLEAIFVKSEYRKNGHGKELLKHCEEWAAEKGCTEFASDCELTNDMSLAFHLNVGFTEVNRVICFTKKLNSKD